MVGLVSAAGLVGFLSEPDPDLKVFALRTLDAKVDLLWTEIVDSISQMYVFSPAAALRPFYSICTPTQ
jgi:26S proteasome regulatory subunit N2